MNGRCSFSVHIRPWSTNSLTDWRLSWGHPSSLASVVNFSTTSGRGRVSAATLRLSVCLPSAIPRVSFRQLSPVRRTAWSSVASRTRLYVLFFFEGRRSVAYCRTVAFAQTAATMSLVCNLPANWAIHKQLFQSFELPSADNGDISIAPCDCNFLFSSSWFHHHHHHHHWFK